MNMYIKHSEDDSLTHYGVKGMKWRKKKGSKILDSFGDVASGVKAETHYRKKEKALGRPYGSVYNGESREKIKNKFRKKSELKSRKNYSKAIKSSLNKAKKATMSTAKKAIKKGKDKWNQRYISKGVANEYMYTYNKKGQTVLLHKPGDRYDTRTGKAIKKKKNK